MATKKTTSGTRGKKTSTAKKTLSSKASLNPKSSSKKTSSKKAFPKAAPKAQTTAKKKSAGPAEDLGFDFIGSFPVRKLGDDKKNDNKKVSTGPVFASGEYTIVIRNSPLSRALMEEFQKLYLGRHSKDKFLGIKTVPESIPESKLKEEYTSKSLQMLIDAEADIAVHNMKDIPLDLPQGITLAAALKREDARDAMVTRSTFGAVQELPSKAKVGATSKRRLMQLRHLRPDLQISSVSGDLIERLQKLDSMGLDAVLVSWAGLKRLNISPRFYVALQSEMILPAPCQGIVGILCRSSDKELVSKLHYIEDSEASWASRCERAFLQKLGGLSDSPVGAFAHRKGTQDPWIIDAVVGDHRSGDILRHREIGTSRCKPESLADKAFTGILAKGARKFFQS